MTGSASLESPFSYFQIYGKSRHEDDRPIHLSLPEVQKKALHALERAPNFYSICLTDLAAQQDKLTNTACIYAMGTILAIAILEQHAKELSEILNERLRNCAITEMTGLAAEKDLAKGSKKEEIYQNIIQLTNDLKNAYLFDSIKEDTWSFFKDAFIGPPCFNGRMITMMTYVAEKQKLLPGSTVADNRDYDAVACQIESLMYEYELVIQPDLPEDSPPPSLENMLAFIKEHAEYTSKYQQIVDSIQFDAIYKRACEIFVR